MSSRRNRFDDFFEDDSYTRLKNQLYNYQVRKRAIERELAGEPIRLVLETGSGISPVMTKTDQIVYSELSLSACRMLKNLTGRGHHVVADATRLPFHSGVFSHVVCSEVLEHVRDDEAVLRELARVTAPDGTVIVTVPHRECFFANDDRYVNHYRRYELRSIECKLRQAGLEPVAVKKVLGPLEKVTMMAAVLVFETVARRRRGSGSGRRLGKLHSLYVLFNQVYAHVVRLDAWLMPRFLASCVLVKAGKRSAVRPDQSGSPGSP